MLHLQSVCESVVFGVPLIMRPTACWKLEWEELEINQQQFYSICKLLSEKVVVVVIVVVVVVVCLIY